MNKKYLAWALISGFLLAIAWPVYGFPLFAFMGFVPLLVLEFFIRNSDGKHKGRKVFWYSYLTFLTWNSITTWWVLNSTIFGGLFALFVNSFLMAIVFWTYHQVAKRTKYNYSLLYFIFSWISFEKFHLWWDFSWPWLNLGNVFADYNSWIQWYEYTGVFGGSLWVLLVNVLLFKKYIHYLKTKDKKSLQKSLIKPVLLILIPIGISFIIKTNYQENGKEITIIAVQPNLDPYQEKYKKNNEDLAREAVYLVQEEMDETVDYILLPETYLSRGSDITRVKNTATNVIFNQLITKYPKVNVITGADLIRWYYKEADATETANKIPNKNVWYDLHNAALQYNAQGIDSYFKSKLVIGVEHVPYRNMLKPILGELMIELGGGQMGTHVIQEKRSVFTSVSNTNAAPIICYESIYGEFCTGYARNKADFFAVITNDAWWGDTQGYKQLLAYTQLRAIENRRSIARAANTGISCIINQKGEVVKSLGYDKKGVVKGKLKLNNKLTFYSRYGDFVARLAILMTILLLLGTFARKKGNLI